MKVVYNKELNKLSNEKKLKNIQNVCICVKI